MKYMKFEIQNFKGIKNLTLDLAKNPNNNIIPLVGLNESGKTTILEAINYFQKDIEDDEKHQFIHKRDKGSFSGDICIGADICFNDDDVAIVRKFIKDIKYTLKSDVKTVRIIRKYNFNDSVIQGSGELWSFILEDGSEDLLVKTSQQKIYRGLYKKNNQEWNKLVKTIKELMPKILYFPDFVFKFPEKIYLQNNENSSHSGEDQDRQNEYRMIVEDILISINPQYKLSSLVQKIRHGGDQEIESAQQILTEMQNKLRQKILKRWDGIFPNTPAKSISIQRGFDNESIYLEFTISEGNSTFKVDERSLGFRWFFGFILFTEFRQAREKDKETIFLFDEPANNLHQASQQKLLELFDGISKQSKIIYSTHSHYLLNPKLILNTFVVNDEGRKNEDDFAYRQDIRATLYREFCSNSKNEVTHFQPLLDTLEYVKNPFEQTKNIVFFEGKNDYYTFVWIYKTCLKLKYDFGFYPGASVTKYENIFREYLACDKNFIAIFDADNSGKENQKKYINNISQELESKVFTLEDINNNFQGMATEQLFTSEEKLEIQKTSFPKEEGYQKSKFNTAIQALFIKKENFDFSKETKGKFMEIYHFIETNLGK